MPSMDVRDDVERLIAEQAIVGYREAMRAMNGAPHGQGFAVTEQAVLAQGRRQVQLVLEQMLSARAEAEQKGGDAAAAGNAEAGRHSSMVHRAA